MDDASGKTRSSAVSSPVERAAGSITRGFLFADLRDYTRYVEAHGAAAAAELLEGYRGTVRKAVA